MVYPMFAMTVLAFFVGLFAIRARVLNVKSGQLSLNYFRLMQGEGIPESVAKTTRCFNNLFEVPVLFYAACLAYVALGVVDEISIVIAWLFVVLRIVQAAIHITYNKVRHRMVAFGLSFFVVMFLWLRLLLLI